MKHFTTSFSDSANLNQTLLVIIFQVFGIPKARKGFSAHASSLTKIIIMITPLHDQYVYVCVQG